MTNKETFGEPIVAITAWMSFLVVATASSIYRVSLNGQVEEMDLSKVENVSDLLSR